MLRHISIYPRGTTEVLTSIVIIKEAVQSSSINQNRRAVDDPQAPAICTITGHTLTASYEIGIIPARDHGKGDGSIGIRLVVCSLGLDLTREDVLGACKLVLVESVMLDSCTHEPDRTICRRGIETATCINGDLCLVWVFDVMVCGPEPVVFEVDSGGGVREVHTHERRDTISVNDILLSRRFRAIRKLQV